MKHYLLQELQELSDLRDDIFDYVLDNTEEVTCKKWEVLFNKGSRIDKLYVLVEGQLTEHTGNFMGLKDDDLRDDNWDKKDNIVTWSRPGKAFGTECFTDNNSIATSTLAA